MWDAPRWQETWLVSVRPDQLYKILQARACLHGDKNHYTGKIPVLDTGLLMKEIFLSPRSVLIKEVIEMLLVVLAEAVP